MTIDYSDFHRLFSERSSDYSWAVTIRLIALTN